MLVGLLGGVVGWLASRLGIGLGVLDLGRSAASAAASGSVAAALPRRRRSTGPATNSQRALVKTTSSADQHVVGVQLVRREQVHARRRCAGSSTSTSSSRSSDDQHVRWPLAEPRPARRPRPWSTARRPSTSAETHVHAAVAGPVGQGAAQRGGLHLLGRPLRVVARRAGRGRRHRRRTAARGSSPGGRGRCPSAGTACGHRRGPRRGSWWSACPGGRRRAGRRRPGGSAGR